MTAYRYAMNEMIYDLVPLIPLQLFRHKYSRLYFVLKCVRIKKSMALLDTSEFMRLVHVIYHTKLMRDCANPDQAGNQDDDLNKIME